MFSLNPVQFESNYDGLTIVDAQASATEVTVPVPAGTPNAGPIVDSSYTLRATLSWNCSVNAVVTGAVLAAMSQWKAKAILQNLETGVAVTREVTVPFSVGAATADIDLSGLSAGTYRLYVTNNLFDAAFGLGHLGVAMVSEGAMVEVFDSVHI